MARLLVTELVESVPHHWVRIWVDKQGRARNVEVVKSNNEIFNDAALAAARQFIFIPAYMNNGPVSVWVAVPFTFRLTSAGKENSR